VVVQVDLDGFTETYGAAGAAAAGAYTVHLSAQLERFV